MNRSRASEMDDASPNACVCVNIIVCIPFHSAFSRLPESKNIPFASLKKSSPLLLLFVGKEVEGRKREMEEALGSEAKALGSEVALPPVGGGGAGPMSTSLDHTRPSSAGIRAGGADSNGSMPAAMKPADESTPLPPIFIGSRSLNLQAESRATAELTGKLLLKRKTKHDLNNLLMETWLNDVLSAGAENETDPNLLMTGQVSSGLTRFGLSRGELTGKGLGSTQVDRLYRSIYVYTVGFHDLLRELFGHNRSCREHVASVWRGVLAVSERALKVQFRSEYVNLVYDYEQSNVDLSDAVRRISQLDAELAAAAERTDELSREKDEIERERSSYESERDTLIASLEREENANHHTMQRYALEVEHRSELQRQMVRLRTELAQVTRDRNEAVEKIRGFKREYELLSSNYEDVRGSEANLSESLRSASARNTFLETREKELRSQIEDFQAKAETAAKRHQQEVRMKTFLKGELQTKNDKLSQLESRVETLQTAQSDAEEETVLLREKLGASEKHISVLEAAVSSEKQDRDRSVTIYNQMQNDLSTAQDDVRKWASKCHTLQKDKDSLTNDKKDLESAHGALRTDLRAKEERLRQSEAACAAEAGFKHDIASGLGVVMQHMDLVQKISNLRWRRSNESANRVVLLEDELLKRGEQLRLAVLRGDDLQSRLNESNAHNADLLESSEELRARNDEVGGEKDRLIARVVKLEEALAVSGGKCTDLEKELESVQSSLEVVRTELRAKETAMQLMESQNFKINDEMRALQAELNGREGQAQHWQREHEKLEQLQRNTVENLRSLQKEYDNLTEKMEAKRADYSQLEVEMSEVNIQLEKKRKKKRTWKSKTEELTATLAERESSIKELEEQLAARCRSLELLRTELEGEKTERASEQTYFGQKEKGYQLQLAENRDSLKQVREKLSEEVQEKERLMDELQQTQDTLSDTKQMLAELRESHTNLNEMKEFLQKDLRDVKQKDYELEQQMIALTKVNESLEEDSRQLVKKHAENVAATKMRHDAIIAKLKREIEERKAGFIADTDCMKHEFDGGIAFAMQQRDAAKKENEELRSEIKEVRTQISGLKLICENRSTYASTSMNSAFEALHFLMDDALALNVGSAAKSAVLTTALKSTTFHSSRVLGPLIDEVHRIMVMQSSSIFSRHAGLARFIYGRILVLFAGDQRLAQIHMKRFIYAFVSDEALAVSMSSASASPKDDSAVSSNIADSSVSISEVDAKKQQRGGDDDDDDNDDDEGEFAGAQVDVHISLMRRLLCVDGKGLSLAMSKLYAKILALCCKHSCFRGISSVDPSGGGGGSTIASDSSGTTAAVSDNDAANPEIVIESVPNFSLLLEMKVSLDDITEILEKDADLNFREVEVHELVSALKKRSMGLDGDSTKVRLCHILEKIFDTMDDKRRIIIDRLKRNFVEAVGKTEIKKDEFTVASLVDIMKQDYIVKGDIIVVNGNEYNITDGEMYESLLTRTEEADAIHSEGFAECIYTVLYDNTSESIDVNVFTDDIERQNVLKMLQENREDYFSTSSPMGTIGSAMGMTSGSLSSSRSSSAGDMRRVLIYRFLKSFISRIQTCLRQQQNENSFKVEASFVRQVDALASKLEKKKPVGKAEDVLGDYIRIVRGAEQK